MTLVLGLLEVAYREPLILRGILLECRVGQRSGKQSGAYTDCHELVKERSKADVGVARKRNKEGTPCSYKNNQHM